MNRLRDLIAERYETARFVSTLRKVLDSADRKGHALDFEEAVQLALLVRRIELQRVRAA